MPGMPTTPAESMDSAHTPPTAARSAGRLVPESRALRAVVRVGASRSPSAERARGHGSCFAGSACREGAGVPFRSFKSAVFLGFLYRGRCFFKRFLNFFWSPLQLKL